MKKLIQAYITIANSIFLVIYIVCLFLERPTFHNTVIFIVSLLSVICISCILQNKLVMSSYILLSIIYFLQSFTFVISNIAWKLLIGTELSFYIIRNGDLTTKLDLKIFNIQFLFNTMSNGENWAIGLNFVHILIFLGLFQQLLKLAKNQTTSRISSLP